LGAAVVAGAWAEARAFGVVFHQLTLPWPDGTRPRLRVLHVSDTHYRRGQHAKAQFLSLLAVSQPDLVVMTGDLVADDDSLDEFLDAIDGLLQCQGVFVRGSNDYFGPTAVNPFGYLVRAPGQARRPDGQKLQWRRLRDALLDAGWHDLDNAAAQLNIAGQAVTLRGTNDAHIDLDNYDAVSGGTPQGLLIGVTHAPYRRVLAAMAADNVALVLAGHTHGGQICLPGRALVTNCDLPPSMAKGLHRWPGEAPSLWLHVSAGVGTSPNFPLRLFCRPEACIIEINSELNDLGFACDL